MKENTYLVRFNMIDDNEDGVAIIPVMTEVHCLVEYWDQISQEQKELEVKEFALSQFEDIGVNLNGELIESVVITEMLKE